MHVSHAILDVRIRLKVIVILDQLDCARFACPSEYILEKMPMNCPQVR